MYTISYLAVYFLMYNSDSMIDSTSVNFIDYLYSAPLHPNRSRCTIICNIYKFDLHKCNLLFFFSCIHTFN